MGKLLESLAAMILRHLEKAETNALPGSAPVPLVAATRRRPLGRRRRQHLELHQIRDPVDLDPRRDLCRTRARQIYRKRRTALLVEANIGEGVVTAPMSKYGNFATRICRPVGLTQRDREFVCSHVIACIGLEYDVRTSSISPATSCLCRSAESGDGVRRAWLPRPEADHLLGADRAGVPAGALPHSGFGAAARARDFAIPALYPARFRHLAAFRRRRACDGGRLLLGV